MDAGTRNQARLEARAIYDRTDVVDSIRAEAAVLVAQSYTEDKNFTEAVRWYDLALRTYPRDLFRKLRDDAVRNQQQTLQPN